MWCPVPGASQRRWLIVLLLACVPANGGVLSQDATGAPIPPDKVAAQILTYFGAWIPPARATAIVPASTLRYVSAADFDAALVQNGLNPADESQTEAFTDRRGATPVVYVRPGARPWVAVHEMIHVYQNPDFRRFGRGLNEGAAHFHTDVAAFDPVTATQLFDVAGSYDGERTAVQGLSYLAGASVLSAAFFGDGAGPIRALCQAVDGKLGNGALDRIAELLGRDATSKPTQAGVEDVDQILKLGYPLPPSVARSGAVVADFGLAPPGAC